MAGLQALKAALRRPPFPELLGGHVLLALRRPPFPHACGGAGRAGAMTPAAGSRGGMPYVYGRGSADPSHVSRSGLAVTRRDPP